MRLSVRNRRGKRDPSGGESSVKIPALKWQPQVLLVCCLATATAARAAWQPVDVDLTRPRVLYRAADHEHIQNRIGREPYRTVFVDLWTRAAMADGVALDDHTIANTRIKARAAKNLAFAYAVDRTVVDGQVVPFPAASTRRDAADRVRDLLVAMYTRSRLAVDPPLGGWDRDINTSEELIQYATAYDTLLGAGYDFGADAARIENNLVALAAELYDNYLNPGSAGFYTNLHQNNHRSKSGAALVVAGIAVAEYAAAPGTDPRAIRDPAAWIDYGLDQVDALMRYVLVTGDGAYAEGPYYFRYAAQNLLPFGRAWDRLVDGRPWPVGDLVIPSLWRHPLFARSLRWMFDMTLPDGSLAPIDDGNPGRSFYFGATPANAVDAAAFAWRWVNAPSRLETEGSVDLAADALVADDDTAPLAPPPGSPSAFYIEGGNAILRSDWSADAVQAVVLGEHDTASQFGRGRDGRGVGPQSHEHADPGSFILHAYGERLAMDPGYLDFTSHGAVNKPRHHNLILVDGEGPVDYLEASLRFRRQFRRPPADGHATLSGSIDSGFVDAVRVTTRYGRPGHDAARISRRFLFPGHAFLVVADHAAVPGDVPATFTWLLHGNGGGDSGGTFEAQSLGGRWTRAQARLDAAIDLTTVTPSLATAEEVHEAPGNLRRTHTVLQAAATGTELWALQVLYPTRTGDAPPDIARLDISGTAALRIRDAAAGRVALAVARAADGTRLHISPETSGLPEIATDGTLLVVDAATDGALRLAWAEGARDVQYGGVALAAASPGVLGIAPTADQAEIIADTSDDYVIVAGLAFVPGSADGACALAAAPADAMHGRTTSAPPAIEPPAGGIVVRLGRERRAILRVERGNSAPGADPGADRRVDIGAAITLDGTASCDLDGDALTPQWTLASAPAGSDWILREPASWHPSFVADRAGPYRIRLVVTDARGAASRPAEVLVVAGPECGDGMDTDLDGWIDTDDPDCSGAEDTSEAAVTKPCPCDCDGDGQVQVEEVITAVAIAQGEAAPEDCVNADVSADGIVTVDEIVAGITSALHGCGASQRDGWTPIIAISPQARGAGFHTAPQTRSQLSPSTPRTSRSLQPPRSSSPVMHGASSISNCLTAR